LSERPEYNDKIIEGYLLAPAAFMTNAKHPIFIISSWADDIEDILHLLGLYEFIPHTDLISWLGHEICNEEIHPVDALICENIAFLLLGINPDQLNMYVRYISISYNYYSIYTLIVY
jgi:hypothetical protein